MDGPFARELDVAIGALQSASRLSQLVISSVDKGVTQKQDLSLVTIADFAVQALLIATFKDAFPHDRFVGEEDASELRTNEALRELVWGLLRRIAEDETTARTCALPSTRKHMCDLIDLAGNGCPGGPGSGRVWVFDPIDGTQNYVRGELYATNVALLIDGEPTVGVVGCPNLPINPTAPLHNRDVDLSGEGCILHAVRGEGAFIRPMHADTASSLSSRRLGPHQPDLGSSPPDIRFVTCVGLVDSALDGVHGVVADRLGAPFPGSDLVPWVLRWAVLAMGLANTTMWVYKRTDRYAKVWDHAGAMLLFEETGGKVTDVRGRAIDWTAGRKMSNNVGFVAAPAGTIHGKVLDTVQSVLRDQGRLEYLD
ncbi:hypothetical protein ESCO_003381 [Escovopsis weberi]|uniref:3'(2'),5'-bisphosphate nucleotidase n=1 Tax=Escovopsis weberi TaxID=150374 RepID=A0A0M8N080_ESCWE|nr:hypothetical protein ESCO_003381 [Escovopsis weberi]